MGQTPQQKTGAAKKAASGTTPLTYPPALGEAPIKFGITLRDYGSFKIGPGAVTASIYLPMPTAGLVDNFPVEFDTKSMGALGGIVSSGIDAVQSGGQSVGDGLWAGLKAIGRNVGQSVVAGLGDVAGVGGDVAKAQGELATGLVNNPNYAVLFKGVKPRTFSFTWRLVAVSPQESGTITNIITALKKAALPATSGTADHFTLTYPNIAYLSVLGPEKNAMLTFSKKGAFIEDVNVKYDGPGHAAFFVGTKAPVQIDLTISVRERGIVTREDIGVSHYGNPE